MWRSCNIICHPQNWTHCFTRLWRKLGWSMRELDRALAVFGGKISEESLAGLAQILQLQERLAQPILSVAGMLGQTSGNQAVER